MTVETDTIHTSPQEAPKAPHSPRKGGLRQTLGRVGTILLLLVSGAGAIKYASDHGIEIPGLGSLAQKVGGAVDQAKDNLAGAAERAIVEFNTRNGDYAMTPVPGREPLSINDVKSKLTIADLPESPSIKVDLPQNVNWGLAAFMEQRQIRLPSPPNETPQYKTSSPSARITGVLIGAEKQPDGSMQYAIQLPYVDRENNLITRNDTKTVPQIIPDKFKEGRKNVTGAIVWLKVFPGDNPGFGPFVTTIGWGEDAFRGASGGGINRSGSGEAVLTAFGRPGDLISARLVFDPGDEAKTRDEIKGYAINRGHGGDPEQLWDYWNNIIKGNLTMAQQLIDNANKPIDLSQQLDGHKYSFTAGTVAFLPQ